MKRLKQSALFAFILLAVISCKKEEDTNILIDDVIAPSNVSARFDITQDNTGLVTILPSADGVAKYLILFGDTVGETPTEFGLF